ncbi:MAG: hypothetical protein DWQ06_05675 [Calditrichaeota bacterium]|nr:MAG: hypothetical protein DWQ06_05675 [Calditrichota bacterium]
MYKISFFTIVLFSIFTFGCSSTKEVVKTETETSSEPDPRALEHFTDGQFFELSGDFYAAIDEYREALNYDSTSATISVAISKAYEAVGKPERGIKFLQNSIKHNPNHLESHRMLANVYLKGGLIKLAEKEWYKILELDSEDLNANYRLAYTSLIKGDSENALKYFLKIAELQPNSTKILIDIAKLYEEQDMPLEAASFYEKALKSEPHNIKLRERIAEIYRKNRMVEKSIPHFEELAKIYPNEIYYQLVLGTLYYVQKDTTNAQEKFKNAKELDPEDWRANFYLGQISVENEEYDSALGYFKNIMEKYPENLEGWIEYGKVLLIQDKLSQAVKHFEKAEERIPGKSVFQYYLGLVFAQMQDLERAASAYEKSLEIQQNNIPALPGVASIYDLQKKYAKSDSAYAVLLEMTPENALILNNYSYSLAVRGEKLKEALQMSKKAISKEPTNSSYLDTIGWIYFKLENLDKALEYIQQAEMVSNEPNWEIYLHLGDIYDKMGNSLKAQENWVKGLALNPNSTELKMKVEKK